jgi:hypothetical protein
MMGTGLKLYKCYGCYGSHTSKKAAGGWGRAYSSELTAQSDQRKDSTERSMGGSMIVTV